MFKLTVISGPNQGSTYAIQDGENWVGRQQGNVIMLPSSRVSKKHCVLVVNKRDIRVQDPGSSNGTFVNGVLTRDRKVKPGDRISVGEYVMEISDPSKLAGAPAAPGFNGLVRQPEIPVSGGRPAARGGRHLSLVSPSDGGAMPGMGAASGGPAEAGPGASNVELDQMPTDLKGKALWYFDKFVMPVFYGFNFKNEWKMILSVLFGLMVCGNLLFSVYPLLDTSQDMLLRETKHRAQLIASEIADRNAPALAAHAETKTDVGSFGTGFGVKLAILSDMDNRVLAPASQSSRYLTTGAEAMLAVKARNAFRAGREQGIVTIVEDTTVVAIEPVKVFTPAVGRNVTAGMAIVSIDASLSVPTLGDMGMIYSQTIIFTGLLAGLLLLIIYRLTLKPFLVLNEDIDKVLKGEMSQVTHEFKVEELNSLWDVINSALQRVPKGGPGGLDGLGNSDTGPTIEDMIPIFSGMAAASKTGLILCDPERKVRYLNDLFEELAGIRADGAVGQDFSGLAREEALVVFMNDLFDRAPANGEPVTEDYEFSGVATKVSVSALASSGGSTRGFVVMVRREASG